jgi:acyl-CoA synthetase (NDP forming)/RimJ/RimL family protein N-acetyltransferase
MAATAEPGADVVLRDGSTARLRPVAPRDAGALQAFLEGLSIESRWQRFFTAGADLAGVARWAADVDARDGYGLVATVGDPERIVGHACFERTGEARAEVAYEVADAFHGRGLGTILTAHLAQAAHADGIERFTADVLPENHDMLEVLARSGFPHDVARSGSQLTVELPTALSAAVVDRYLERERSAAAAAVSHFLEPESVAVVGATARPRSVGRQVVESVLRSGFDGPLHAVNRGGKEVLGLTAHRSVAEIPDPVELVVVATPAATVPDVARDCALGGVRALLVLSGGFAEAGEEGAARQRELLAICRAAGMRLLGPNCLGAMGAARPIDVTFSPTAAPPGRIGLLSQSGGVGLALIERAGELGVGLSSFVSIGNRPDLSLNDVLEYWEEDEATDAALLYAESFGNPRNFVAIARRMGRRKPIVAVRAGRTAVGARAASSHTGAVVAGSDVGVDALLRQAGVIRADTLGDLFDVATVIGSQPLPAGRRVAIVTNAGGPAILCADACESGGLGLPELSPRLRARLAEIAPGAATANPVDMLAAAGPDAFHAAFAAIAASGEVDAAIAIYTPVLGTSGDEVRAALVAAAELVDLPLLAVVFGGERSGSATGIAELAYPESAARALALVTEHAEWRRRPRGRLPEHGDVERGQAASLLGAAVADGGGRWLDERETEALLRCWGIPTVETRHARGPSDAGRAADELGGRVVLKAAVPGLHKTDVGAVELGLAGATEVAGAARRMSRRLRRRGIEIGGFTVQRQLDDAVEMLVGITTDPLLGPLVACGAGGTLVELVRDVAVRLAPITDVEASEMVRSLAAHRLLEGYRGRPRADVAALEDVLLRVAALAAAHPEVVEVDCNPVMAGPHGAVAVDARVRVAPPPPRRPWPSVGAEPPLVR